MSDLSTIKLRQKYQIETGIRSVHTLYNQDDEGYTDKYVKWLESISKKANGDDSSGSKQSELLTALKEIMETTLEQDTYETANYAIKKSEL